jgi:hypothetical protein
MQTWCLAGVHCSPLARLRWGWGCLTPRRVQDTVDLDWHDREIRFDVKLEALELRRGEVIIDSLEPVEDTKGNNGESGVLQVTNLRMIWMATSNFKTNLSVGYGAVVNIHIRTAQSRLKGNCEALFVLTKYNGSRFEFIFTNLVRESPRLFTTVQAVFRSCLELLVHVRLCAVGFRPSRDGPCISASEHLILT